MKCTTKVTHCWSLDKVTVWRSAARNHLGAPNTSRMSIMTVGLEEEEKVKMKGNKVEEEEGEERREKNMGDEKK